MKDSKKIVEQTLNFDSPSRIPRQCWLLPWAEKKYPEYVKILKEKYPDDIESSPLILKSGKIDTDKRYDKGTYTDDWNCRFDNIHGGVIGIVTNPVLEKWDSLESYEAPSHLLDLDIEAINSFCSGTEKFVLRMCSKTIRTLSVYSRNGKCYD